MATELFFTKTATGGFRPADDNTAEALKGIKMGDVIKAQVSKPRNGKHHRKYWALIKIIAENTDNGWTQKQVHQLFKDATRHYDIFKDAKGNEHREYKSISFASMDQLAFNQFYDGVIQITVNHILKGMPESDLRREVEDLCLSY
ncbi:DUF1367 family protein [Curvivirga aplysinae]|uniref:DUF1367 family protein n=1 Tax=Curvivirga aplysinae TaxID=2529852 RepID=UPI001C3FDABF|nr:DUF1367 family protein [Curvivirga aplysinae]